MRNTFYMTLLILSAAQSQLALAQQANPLVKAQTKPIEPMGDTVGLHYWGKVTELTKDSITIEWPGQLPKKFAVSEALAAGKMPKEPRLLHGRTKLYDVSTADMYRLKDVKVGDLITILYARLGEADICDHIRIWKRPGGQVPPLPEEAEWLASYEGRIPAKARASVPPATLAWIRQNDAKRIRYHERMNAYWDLEDKGIPYPEKFGRERRWPVAPMPRKAEPTGPVIAP